ncbi:peptidylprolyl isomerase [Nocardioides sp. JQ2195]|uniref:peptidylprolyl isomerase n=1 Tax=Nocardioides sp. JQ2195 TaxID=2592334 RepID=UPI00143E121E|nr:peptidylprolyl isomerase [Nocardioides sp. JQ2195]QIX26646.1 peptidylprolyl isomerase [Nocardioides sp. JQ2195]
MLKRSLALATALTLFSFAACSNDDGGGNDDVTAENSATSAAPAESTSPEAAAGAGSCSYPADGSPAKEATPPPATAPRAARIPVTLETSVGDLKASLDARRTPCTVNSFLSLADQDYFDDTECHRLTTEGIHVLQCGDPTGTGMGGPGYRFDDELTGKETYPAGTLAMANAGPGTNGSQFFMVYKDSPLPAAYTVFGKVDVASIRILQKVAAKGSDNANGPGDGSPNTKVVIDEVDD